VQNQYTSAKDLEIADITHGGIDEFTYARQLKEAWMCGRFERIPRDPCAKGVEQHAQPRALEAGVTCDEYPLATPVSGIHLS
jgi:hypothetical protein